MPFDPNRYKRKKDQTLRVRKANTRAMRALRRAGVYDEFLDYQAGPGVLGRIGKGLKSFGTGVLDVVQRPEFATAQLIEGAYQDSPVPERLRAAGSELLSGIGGIQGQKITIPETLAKNIPEYQQFREEHPIASIGTDLALSIGLDPTTYIPGVVFARGASKLAKGVKFATKPVRGTAPYEKVAGTLGRAFDPAYLWKKAGAKKGYDILWTEGKFAEHMRRNYGERLKPVVDEIAKMTPDQVKLFIRKMYHPETVVTDEAVEGVAAVTKGFMREIGEKDFTAIGKEFSGLLDDYFPNDPKLYTDLMENVGERVPSGHLRGLQASRATFEKGKKLRTADDFLNWLQNPDPKIGVGVSDANLGEVVIRNLVGRSDKSVARIRTLSTHAKWTKELPEIFREVPFGTKQVWDQAVRPGESLWMPAGNLRFFSQSKWDSLPKAVRDILEDGGQLTDDLVQALNKEMVVFTTRLKGVVWERSTIGCLHWAFWIR